MCNPVAEIFFTHNYKKCYITCNTFTSPLKNNSFFDIYFNSNIYTTGSYSSIKIIILKDSNYSTAVQCI